MQCVEDRCRRPFFLCRRCDRGHYYCPDGRHEGTRAARRHTSKRQHWQKHSAKRKTSARTRRWRAEPNSSGADEVWNLFTGLLKDRNHGFSRLDFWPNALEHLTQVAGNVLANCPDPAGAWMEAYIKTEPQRRRAGFPHRYVDLGVGMPSRVLVEIGAAAATILSQQSRDHVLLYDAVELAARRMWLVRPGAHGIDWEGLYASVLAQCAEVGEQGVSKLLALLEVGSNSPTLVCSTLEYCLEAEAVSDLPRLFEERFGVRISNMLRDADFLLRRETTNYPSLQLWVETVTRDAATFQD